MKFGDSTAALGRCDSKLVAVPLNIGIAGAGFDDAPPPGAVPVIGVGGGPFALGQKAAPGSGPNGPAADCSSDAEMAAAFAVTPAVTVGVAATGGAEELCEVAAVAAVPPPRDSHCWNIATASSTNADGFAIWPLAMPVVNCCSKISILGCGRLCSADRAAALSAARGPPGLSALLAVLTLVAGG